MNITNWQPFRDMDEMINRMVPALTRWRGESNGDSLEWAPMADISETDKEFLVRAELSGVKREDVKVTVEDGMLTLSGERKREHEDKSEKFHGLERYVGGFSRTFYLPESADLNSVHAESKDGTLTVHIPKLPSAAPKRIEVKVQ